MGCLICLKQCRGDFKEEVVWYCAYGSNLSRDRITKRVTAHEILGEPLVVRFKAYKLAFNKHSLWTTEEGFANLEKSYGGLQAEAVIWPVTESAISILDGYEYTPAHYIRETWLSKECLTEESIKVAPESFEIYIANPKTVRENLRPKKEYLLHLQTGAKEFGLSDSYQEMLNKVETLGE